MTTYKASYNCYTLGVWIYKYLTELEFLLVYLYIVYSLYWNYDYESSLDLIKYYKNNTIAVFVAIEHRVALDEKRKQKYHKSTMILVSNGYWFRYVL